MVLSVKQNKRLFGFSCGKFLEKGISRFLLDKIPAIFSELCNIDIFKQHLGDKICVQNNIKLDNNEQLEYKIVVDKQK